MEEVVYARQSVEKKNSISIEGQIELCRRAASGNLSVYQDRGYSGKNTERPDFQRLLRDVQAGKNQQGVCLSSGPFFSLGGRLWPTVGNSSGASC